MNANVFNFERHAPRLLEAIERSGDDSLHSMYVDLCCDCGRRNSDYVIVSDKVLATLKRLLKSL